MEIDNPTSCPEPDTEVEVKVYDVSDAGSPSGDEAGFWVQFDV
jgi:hypothetical protein